MDIIINVAIFLISAIIFSIIGYIMRKKTAERKIESAETESERIFSDISSQREFWKMQNVKQKISEKKKL